MFEVRDLYVSYGKVKAVQGMTLTAEPGKVTLVLGANGAGKTTTLRAAAGLHRPDAGTVSLHGRPITGLAPHKIVKRGLVLVPEGRRIFAPLTVLENLRMGGYTAPRAELTDILDRVFDMFPVLKERQDGQAGLLSGGEQQMLAFGRALMGRPKFMMLDEPSMGLAPSVADTIFDRISQIHREDGVTILLVEQRVAEALERSDHGYVLETGHIVLEGRYEALLADDRVRRSYLGLTEA